jgi:rare lipoprotein A (peptidoglycan hydrolase)
VYEYEMTPRERWARLGRRMKWALVLAVVMAMIWPPKSHASWQAAGSLHHTIASTYGYCGIAGEPCGGMACNGKRVRKGTWAVAHKTLRCGTWLLICVRGRCHHARVLDRGPFVAGRDIDLTWRLGKALRVDGIANATYRVVKRR